MRVLWWGEGGVGGVVVMGVGLAEGGEEGVVGWRMMVGRTRHPVNEEMQALSLIPLFRHSPSAIISKPSFLTFPLSLSTRAFQPCSRVTNL